MLTVNILTAIGAYENHLRAERTRLGKIKRIQAGYWMGGSPPFGYQITAKKLAENPDESKWVKFVYESYLQGESVKQISLNLTLNHVRTRRNNVIWSLGAVESLLTNTHFGGNYTYIDKKTDLIIPCTCPAILDASLIEDVRKEKQRRSSRRNRESNQKHFYLLRELLVCGHCGAHFSARTYDKQKRSNYYCPRKERNYANKPTKCTNSRYLKIDETDRLVCDTVKEVLSDSDLFKEEIRGEFMKRNNLRKRDYDERELKRRIRKLNQDSQKLAKVIPDLEVDSLLADDQSRENVRKTITSINLRRYKFQAEKEELEDRLYSINHEAGLLNWVDTFKEQIDDIDDLPDQQKKKYLTGIIEKITVHTIDKQTHELQIKFHLPYINEQLQFPDGENPSAGNNIKTLTIKTKKK